MIKIEVKTNKKGDCKLKRLDWKDTTTSEVLTTIGVLMQVVVDNDPQFKNELEVVEVLKDFYKMRNKGEKKNGKPNSKSK